MIAGGFLSTATFALSFGVTGDVGVALPLATIAGMTGAVIIASPWRTKIANKLRTGPALPIFNNKRQTQAALTFDQTTPLMEERDTMIRPAQRSQPSQRRQPVTMRQEVRQHVKPVNDSRLANQLDTEIKQINSTLAALGVNAGTKPQWTQVGGKQLVFYTIKAGPGQRIDAIEKCLPELAEVISGLRRKQTLVRMLRFPLRLEVEHPFHESLTWNINAIDGAPNTALIGKSYDNGPSDFWLPFSDAPHILVAGTTGAGKSVLLNAMVLSLAWNTSPKDLVIYLVDLKNKSLAGLRSLPHVKRFASDVESAAEVVKMAGEALDTKIQNRNIVDTRQHLLVIDEYADLSTDTASMDIVNHLVRMGREDAVNVIIGTQHPTASVLGKEGTKQNFPMRLVGAVTDASSAQVAAGRAGTGAHLLPRKRGAFLAVQGGDIKRINTYMVTHSDVADTVNLIRQKWANRPVMSGYGSGYDRLSADSEPVMGGYGSVMTPVMSGYGSGYDRLHTSETDIFPISEGRPLNRREAVTVQALAMNDEFYHRGELSLSRLCKHVYGSKDPNRLAWIKEAVGTPVSDGKIIRLRKAV